MGKAVDKSKLEFASHPPAWARELTEEEETSIREIYKFFVVNTPCKDISALSIPLTKYGWDDDTPPKDGYLQKRILESAGLDLGTTLFIGTQREDMKELFGTAAMDAAFGDTYDTNRIAILNDGNLLMALFRNLRNAFAHCRFTLKKLPEDVLFIMENGAVSGSNCEIKSRMLIKKSTFVEWIHIITTEADTEKAVIKAEQDAFANNIVSIVSSKEIKSIAQLAEEMGIEVSVIEKFTRNNRDMIEYSRHEKKWILCSSEGADNE